MFSDHTKHQPQTIGFYSAVAILQYAIHHLHFAHTQTDNRNNQEMPSKQQTGNSPLPPPFVNSTPSSNKSRATLASPRQSTITTSTHATCSNNLSVDHRENKSNSTQQQHTSKFTKDKASKAKPTASTHRAASNATNTSTQAPAVHFDPDDFNFTGYDLPRLVFLCEHKLVLRTRFPKLVVALYHHPSFANCISRYQNSQNLHMVRQLLVSRLVDAVSRFTADPGTGELCCPKGVTLNEALCRRLVTEILGDGGAKEATEADDKSSCETPQGEMVGQPIPQDIHNSHEHDVLHRVNRTMKQYHHWKDTSHPNLELAIETPVCTRRTRRQRVAPTQPSGTSIRTSPENSIGIHQKRVIQI